VPEVAKGPDIVHDARLPRYTPPAALIARAGHSSFTTPQAYIDLAGASFREEADRLERRLWGDTRYKKSVDRGPFVAGCGWWTTSFFPATKIRQRGVPKADVTNDP
jgi:hypothetical protein